MTILLGADISKWNTVNWKALEAEGVAFVGFRVTWSRFGVDPRWRANLAGIKSIGALPIGYHVEDPHVDGAIQARHLLDTLGEDAGTAWMLDVEPTEGQAPASARRWADVAADFADELSALTRGAPPMIYGSPGFLDGLPLRVDLAGCPLWLAQWFKGAEDLPAFPPSAPFGGPEHAVHEAADAPRLWIPRPWHKATIWQTGTRAQPDGSQLDRDRFEGTREDLERELAVALTHARG